MAQRVRLSPRARPVTRGVRAWWGLIGLIALGAVLQAAGWTGMDASTWDWHIDLAWAQPWRWWTAAWVHLHPLHLFGNLAGMTVLAWTGWVANLPTRAALCGWLSWPATHVALAFEPRLQAYAGASGVLHALAAILAVEWLAGARRARGERWLGAALLAGLAFKLWRESAWHAPVVDTPLFPVAVTGHLAGVLIGVVLGLTAVCLVRMGGAVRPSG